MHLRVDNANVVGHVGRIIARKDPVRPFQILLDGDLLLLIQRLVFARGVESTTISKVKGHADEDMIRRGRVRRVDKIGNDLADDAANRGRLGVRDHVQVARRDIIEGCREMVSGYSASPSVLHCYLRGLWSMMMEREALPQTLWSGVLVLKQRSGRPWILSETWLWFRARLVWVLGASLNGRVLTSLLLILKDGHFRLVHWSNWLLSLVVSLGLLWWRILGLEESPLLSS